MFGTFVPERAEEPARYGIVRNLATFNVLKIAFHEWIGIFSDLAKAKNRREAFCYVFAPPGWSPDGSRDTSDSLKSQWISRSAQSQSG